MMAMHFTLEQWLARLEAERIPSKNLDLADVVTVKNAMDLLVQVPVITVAGTNGKGSTCAFLEVILLKAGYRVGCYTSPHLLKFNERARLNGESATDEALITHFERVEIAKQKLDKAVHLSYFEFTFLAILSLFLASDLDVIILEVGVGGRLDAVNVVDASCAVVTSIDLDHTDFLGETRAQIATEKAGIFRSHRPAICGDPMPPESLFDAAKNVGADLWLVGRDFFYQATSDLQLKQWNYIGRQQKRLALAFPALRGANQLLNASAALAVLESLADCLPVTIQDIRLGLAQVNLPGRFQVLPGRPVVVLDVAHNPHAVAVLADNLDKMGYFSKTYAVFGAMQDKEIAHMITYLKDQVDDWHVVDLPVQRAASAKQIFDVLTQEQMVIEESQMYQSVALALESVFREANENDRILVFGSFITVSAALSYFQNERH